MPKSNVRIISYERDPDLRQSMKAALHQEDFTQSVITGGIRAAQAAIQNDEADLAILDMDKEGPTLRELMRDIRHHEAGNNPFPVTVALTGTSSDQTICKIIDSGFDSVLLKPLAMTTLVDRVQYFTRRRAPFVVTSDYIGPDRRRVKRPGPSANLVTVPNPVSIMANDEMTQAQMLNLVKDAAAEVNDRRIVSNGGAIKGIVGDLAAKFMYGEIDLEFVSVLKKLRTICDDMDRRLARSDFAHVAELCATTKTVVTRLLERPMTPEARDMELLQKMGTAIERAFEGDDHDIAVAQSISDSVRAVA